MTTRPTYDLFKIDGVPMLAPDEEPSFSYEDIDSADTGRDETGHMHRSVVLFKVGKWGFQYSTLTHEDYIYMENLFNGKASFQFTRPSRTNPETPETTECYRSKYSLAYKNAKTGKWKNYKFNVIEM